MADEPETPQTKEEETDIYDNRVYNMHISFVECKIEHLHIEQYGRPITVPPPPPGGPINP
jgi:hypothetical protein